MVIVLEDHVALTPAGNPLAPETPELEMPVAPVVVIVIFVNGVLIHNVGVDEGEPAVLVALMVRLVPLSDPLIAGELLTTLILYPEPLPVPEGIVTEILWLPLPSELTVCKSVGEVNEPDASDNCALNVLPLKFPAGV